MATAPSRSSDSGGDAVLPVGVAVAEGGERSESPLAQAVRRLRKSTTALIGGAVVVILLVVAMLADVLAPQSPIASDQTQTFARPSAEHPLGTDQLGRDMLSRVIHGTRVSLAVGVSSVVFALFWECPSG